jgi:hypothetical protein
MRWATGKPNSNRAVSAPFRVEYHSRWLSPPPDRLFGIRLARSCLHWRVSAYRKWKFQIRDSRKLVRGNASLTENLASQQPPTTTFNTTKPAQRETRNNTTVSVEHYPQETIARLHFEKAATTCTNKRFEKVERTPAPLGQDVDFENARLESRLPLRLRFFPAAGPGLRHPAACPPDSPAS